MMFDFRLQTMDQRFDLEPQAEHSLSTDDFGINDRTDAPYGLVEIVVDHDVLVLFHRLQLRLNLCRRRPVNIGRAISFGSQRRASAMVKCLSN